MTNNDILSLIAVCETLKNENKLMRNGIKSAKHLVKRHESHSKSFKQLLKPSSKQGHKDALRAAQEACEWELSQKKKEIATMREGIRNNNTLISALTYSIKTQGGPHGPSKQPCEPSTGS